MATILRNRMLLPPEQRDAKADQSAVKALEASLKVLDDHLKHTSHLVGNDFTIADLNVASQFSLASMAKLEFPAAPTASAWLERCLSRPAAQKLRSMK
jgi:glutathione S-transferase